MVTPLPLLLALAEAAAPPPPTPTRPLAALVERAAAPAGAPAAPARPRADRAQVLAAVRAEWSRYDTGNSGRLTPLQFSTWVMQANGARVAPAGTRGGQGVKPVSAMNATARAFARADANHDGAVTPDEMTDFLMR